MLRNAVSALTAAGVQVDGEAVTSVAPLFDQLTSVFYEVSNPARQSPTCWLLHMVSSFTPPSRLRSLFCGGVGVVQVGNGTVEFTPTPAENTQIFRSQYRVPATLLVQFTHDAIDESPRVEALLREVYPNGKLPTVRCVLYACMP